MPRPKVAPRDWRTAAQRNEELVLNLGVAAPAAPAEADEEFDAGSDEQSDGGSIGAASDLEAAFEESEEALALEHEFSTPALEEPAEDTAFTAAECALAADVKRGYVTCKLPPWQAISLIGTLEHSELRGQKMVTMRCRRHGARRCFIMKKRASVTDDMLLRWLLLGDIPPAETCEADLVILAGEHRKAWQAILDSRDEVAAGPPVQR